MFCDGTACGVVLRERGQSETFSEKSGQGEIRPWRQRGRRIENVLPTDPVSLHGDTNAEKATYVTHDQSEALAMSDKIVVLNAGKAEQIDTLERLCFTPKTSFVADFIGGANFLEGDVLPRSGTGDWEVETPIGRIRSSAGTVAPGKRTHLCWRPECARLGDGSLTGKIVHRAFQGHFMDLSVETNGVTYRIQTGASDVHIGETIRFSLASEDALLLEDAA